MRAKETGVEGGGGSLRRELGLTGAVATGLGSILGAGVFVSLGIAAGVAGSWVLVAIVLAGGLAVCNALSSAQLAASHPVSGGTYEYGYRYLGPLWGFAAGWMFLCAKSASAATAALGCAAYVLPWLGVGEAWVRWSAVGVCLLMTLVVMGGVRRSTWMNLAIVGVAMAALLVFSAAALGSAFVGGGEVRVVGVTADVAGSDGGVRGLLYATALVFVAYTGYGRIATLGEEVREPQKTIPRAIVITLAVSGGLYLLVGVAAMAAVGAERFGAASDEASGGLASPVGLGVIAGEVGGAWLGWAVTAGAVAAMLGVLLNLVLGLSRVALAMGRRGDLPSAVARVDGEESAPRVAVAAVGAVVAGLASIGSVEATWSLSAFTVLLYYAVTNLAALRLPRGSRRYPRWVAWCGLAGCLFLACWVPAGVWGAGLGVLAAGLAWHGVRRVLRRGSAAV